MNNNLNADIMLFFCVAFEMRLKTSVQHSASALSTHSCVCGQCPPLWFIPKKHKTLNLCWLNVGSPSFLVEFLLFELLRIPPVTISENTKHVGSILNNRLRSPALYQHWINVLCLLKLHLFKQRCFIVGAPSQTVT